MLDVTNTTEEKVSHKRESVCYADTQCVLKSFSGKCNLGFVGGSFRVN